MTTYSSKMRAYPGSSPNIDIDNPTFNITAEWTWPSGNYWSAFQIVRSIRSPAVRVEEGHPMFGLDGAQEYQWEHKSPETGNPIFVDEQPPPGEWVFYTLFVLDTNRVWTYAASASAIGIADYGWTLRLPELLPGIATSSQHGVADPAEQSHDLVQFLQSPGTYLDATVTMAEALQFFWDPRAVPPQALSALSESWGYRYTEALGVGRNREILAALRVPAQGSIPSITAIAAAASGGAASATISNNLMLDPMDSSFETPTKSLTNTRWTPTAGTEIRDYYQWTFPAPLLPANVLTGYFLHIDDDAQDRTFKCGAGTPEHVISNGIPIRRWTHVRMGCYAFDETGGAVTQLTMGMDIHDAQGALLGSITTLGPVPLTASWAYYATTSTGAAPDGVSIGATITESKWAYGVPWFTVSDACSVDLVVVDDG